MVEQQLPKLTTRVRFSSPAPITAALSIATLDEGFDMPIVNDDQIKALLAEGRITAISIDTSIFDQKRLQLNSATMQALAGLKDHPFIFLLSKTVAKEVLAHLERAAVEALQSAKKAIGQALFAFETDRPEREALLGQISGGRTPEEAANQRWDTFIKDTGCEVLTDTVLVTVAKIYDSYFSGQPPFGSGRKKDEFPDALALYALEQTAADRGIEILVVSKDDDWKSYCETSPRLYHMPEIERALALITDAPLNLQKSIATWLTTSEASLADFVGNISACVELLDFTVNAHPNYGEAETSAWAGRLQRLEWPDEEEIDIIELLEAEESGVLRVVVSLPLHLIVEVTVELVFSIWDSEDKTSHGLGSRIIEVEKEIYVRTNVTLDVQCFGEKGEKVTFVESELEDWHYEIELGDINVFEHEDYLDEAEQHR